MVAEYKTSGTSTILVVVEPNDELIFTTNQSFEIVEMIVANSNNEIEVNTISEFGLSSAYPNPFNPTTTLGLALNEDGMVNMSVFNVRGQMVEQLISNDMKAGYHNVVWNANAVSSGMYFVRVEAGANTAMQKLMLLK